jgi:hypothetical protein
MPFRTRREEVLHLHRLRRRRGRQPSTLERAEELCSRQSQFHIREVHSDARTGPRAQWVEGLLCLCGDFVVGPARGKVPGEKFVRGYFVGGWWWAKTYSRGLGKSSGSRWMVYD